MKRQGPVSGSRYRGGSRIDIRDVAARAGVSISTVSRVMNRVSTVNPAMAKRVWRAIGELNYFPNTQARALVSGRSKILGLIVSEITNPFFPELIQRFEDVAIENGYEVLIASTNYDPERMALCVRRMIERNVDGVAVMTFGIEGPVMHELATRKVPLVFIDAGPDRPNVSTLTVDYARGIRQGVQHLAALGHRRIAFISGPLQLHSASARQKAFLAAAREIGIADVKQLLVEGDHTLEGGIRAMERLLDSSPPPTAVMCSNDMTAIGVLHCLFEKGVDVPDGLSVIGFDDVHIAQFTLPPLTTVRMACLDIARGAVMALRCHLEQVPSTVTVPKLVPTELVVRQTTAHPRGSMDDLERSNIAPRTFGGCRPATIEKMNRYGMRVPCEQQSTQPV